MNSRGSIFVYLVLAIVVIAIAVEGFFIFKTKKVKENLTEATPNPAVEVKEGEALSPTIIPLNDDNLNILLLGMGGAGHDGGTLSDSITLASINKEKKIVTLIAIPRDLWVPIPVDWDFQSWQKINAAYAIGLDQTKYPNKKPEFRGSLGGGNLSKFVVGQATGLKVNYFLAIDFSNFINAIDSLGGVDVEVAKTFDDYFYPIKGLENETCNLSPEQITQFHQQYSGFELEKQFTCRYEHLHFEKGLNKMDGITALKFIRSRHSNEYGGDFARGERAQAVLIAIGKKLLSQNLISPDNSTFKKLTSVVTSDISLKSVSEILNTLGNLNQYEIKHLYLTDQNVLIDAKGPNGAFTLIPKKGDGDFEEVRSFIKSSME